MKEKTNIEFFKNRKVVLVTNHGKEMAIAPVLEQELGVKVEVLTNFNTDDLGTFTGEIERSDNQLNTAKSKAQQAFQFTDAEIAIASEGSFAAHPSAFFIQADFELIYWIDRLYDIESVGQYITTETNFSKLEFQRAKEAHEFAAKAGFPEHGIIVSCEENRVKKFRKGIQNQTQLNEAIDWALKNNNAFIETDMRAHMNPTRMKAIEKASHQLVEQLKSVCPQCHFPAYQITQKEAGLPCSNCLFPTRLIKANIYSCKHCKHEERRITTDTLADPMYCDNCNP